MSLNLLLDFKKILIVGKITVSIFFVTIVSSCGGNLFQLTAKKDSAEAIYQDARNSLNTLDYDTAISKLIELQGKDAGYYLKCEKVDGIKICPREDLAGAYASRCGLNFVSFVSALSSSTGSAFLYFMKKFQNVKVVPSECYEAQKVIETFGASSTTRTTEQNLFMAVLGMAKMGTYLREVADADQDGTTDSTYNSCDSTSISVDYLRQVISGMGLVIDNLAALSAVLSGSSSALTDLDTIKNTCGASCVITDPNSSNFNETVTRVLLRSSDKGVEPNSGCLFPLCCL